MDSFKKNYHPLYGFFIKLSCAQLPFPIPVTMVWQDKCLKGVWKNNIPNHTNNYTYFHSLPLYVPYARKFWHKKNLVNLHFRRFYKSKKIKKEIENQEIVDNACIFPNQFDNFLRTVRNINFRSACYNLILKCCWGIRCAKIDS